MNDSQIEQLIKLLEDSQSAFRVIAVCVFIGMFALWFILLILWAKYYDKYLDIKEKKRDDNIRRIINEEKRK